MRGWSAAVVGTVVALGLLQVAAYFGGVDWPAFHGVFFVCFGILMLGFVPSVEFPRWWWFAAGLFFLLAMAQFLPAEWGGIPGWRRGLEVLGVRTGPLVVIQARQAVELLLVWFLGFGWVLWLGGFRVRGAAPGVLALLFACAVAVHALVARWAELTVPAAEGGLRSFGFFPNRNHTALFLTMGALSGVGCLIQSFRDRKFAISGVALVAASVCLRGLAVWSASRAGVVLFGIGLLMWLPMLGRRYLGRNGLWAVGLFLVAVVGLFVIADTEVRARIGGTVDRVGEVMAGDDGGGRRGHGQSGHPEFRIPVALDTVSMIADFPLTGVGSGQFAAVFPQYRRETIGANDADSVHPESDWLWVAAEAGIPAALVLGGLVVAAALFSWKRIRNGRQRVLRSACLCASLLLPLHGWFDVPGHRIGLVGSAVFLYMLSLPVSDRDRSPTGSLRWFHRVVGLTMVVVGVWMVRVQWFGGEVPSFLAGDVACREAGILIKRDQAMQRQAESGGREYLPSVAEDPLEEAARVLAVARERAPLHRGVRRMEGYIALHYDDRYEFARKSFAVERALDPSWVALPMGQALAWSRADPRETVLLWEEALRRAERVDLLRKDGSAAGLVKYRIADAVRLDSVLRNAWEARHPASGAR